jgi:hypothetical protein
MALIRAVERTVAVSRIVLVVGSADAGEVKIVFVVDSAAVDEVGVSLKLVVPIVDAVDEPEPLPGTGGAVRVSVIETEVVDSDDLW